VSARDVCAVDELPPGTRRIVDVGGRSVGVFNLDGDLYALTNVCPHQGGPLCEGTVGGTMLPSEPHRYRYGMEGRLVRCPWHGWEIDLASGRPFFDPERARVPTFPVAVRDGRVVIER
jgi:3-phenylpropionate/trans-cinnamate dioxygenase ferredoxin subunit